MPLPAKYAPGDWRKPNRDQHPTELTEKQKIYLDWRTDAEVQSERPTKMSIAAELGVNPSTLAKWEKTPLFIAEWNKRLAEMNVSPERTQRLMERLYTTAAGDRGDAKPTDEIKATELYMRLVEKISPPVQLVKVELSRPASELSDDELALKLEQQARALRGETVLETTATIMPARITTAAGVREELARDLELEDTLG